MIDTGLLLGCKSFYKIYIVCYGDLPRFAIFRLFIWSNAAISSAAVSNAAISKEKNARQWKVWFLCIINYETLGFYS